MERLTYVDARGRVLFTPSEEVDENPDIGYDIRQIAEYGYREYLSLIAERLANREQYCEMLESELKAYMDAKKQGRLIILPCKVGDIVYKIWYAPCHNGNDIPDSWDCCGCEDVCDLRREIFEVVVPNVEWILQHMKYFGDCVWFLTKAEAEAALEKMKGEEHE